MKIAVTATIIFASGLTFCLGVLASSDWNLRRNTSNGACSVQPADSLPQLGEFLAKYPTRKAACEEAKARKTDDAGDSAKCFTYTNGSRGECQQDGVSLSQ